MTLINPVRNQSRVSQKEEMAVGRKFWRLRERPKHNDQKGGVGGGDGGGGLDEKDNNGAYAWQTKR